MKNEELLVALLKQNNLHLSCAESCTGGLLISTIINVSGASNVVNQSFVTYAIKAKEELLHVDKDVISKYGVASNEVSELMVLGLREKYSDEVLISTTGFAGENDNLCFYSIMYKNQLKSNSIKVSGSRNEARYNQVQEILNDAYLFIKECIKKGIC